MFEDRTEENIKKEMFDDVSNEIDKGEKSLTHDAICPAATKFAEAYINLQSVADKIDVENLEGEELERFVYQRTGTIKKNLPQKQLQQL